MTTIQREHNATDRAILEGITIAARGSIKSTGSKFYIVNGSHAGTQYTVLVHQHSLECSCPAGAHGIVCKHRACVHAALVAEANAFRALDKGELALLYELHVAATKLDAALDRQREARETSTLAGAGRGNAPVSIFK